MQRVISVNFTTKQVGQSGYKEYEFEKLNQYLKDGYKIIDKIPVVTKDGLYTVNITFILEK